MNRPAAVRWSPRIPLVAAALAVAALAGCAAPRVEPVELAPDFYRVTKDSGLLPVKPSDLRIQLEEQASRFCQARGKAVSVLDTRLFEGDDAHYPSATIQFRCV